MNFFKTLEKDFVNIANSISPVDYSNLSEKIKKIKNTKKINICILSSYTSEILKDFIVVQLAQRGIACNLNFLPYNYLEQEILNDKSLIYSSKNDVILVLYLFNDFIDENSKKISKPNITRISKSIKTIQKKSKAKIFISNFFQTQFLNYGDLYAEKEYSKESLILESNIKLLAMVKKKINVHILDLKNVILRLGTNKSFNSKLNFFGKVPFSINAQIEVSKEIAKFIKASYFTNKKCLVLDADNTLWGGIVGELGFENIMLSESYPGNTFKNFQNYLLNLHQRGIILALAIKNNFDYVKDALSKNDDSILKLNHFSSVKVNWDEKFINLQKISHELNIGLDSMVFFDDSPFERELIKKKLPEVTVLDVPNDSSKYVNIIENSELFDSLIISAEDKKRNKLYSQEKKRKKFKENFKDMNGFLSNLKMKVKFYNIDKGNLQRVVQLLSKTNQFNLTTKRHSESDLIKMFKNGSFGYSMRLSDCFGDNGIVGVIIISPFKNSWYVDTLLLSCRVIGRKVEDLMLSFIINKILEKNNSTKFNLLGEYIKTTKNQLVADFYKSRGFKKEHKFWKKSFSTPVLPPNLFKITK